MTAKERDTSLLWRAFNAGYDYDEMQRCEDACKTESMKRKIHDLRLERYRKEEAMADMI